jgi:anti-sigma regulatory factor (Ser/Thr protein kinase)
MNADLTPATPGPRHPLAHIADAPTRQALARLLASRYDAVLTDGRTELARREDLPGQSCPEDLLPTVFSAFMELLRAGTLDGVESAFAHALEAADPSLTLFDAADRVRHAMGAMTMAAFPAVMEAWDDARNRREAVALLLGAADIGGARLHAALTRTVLREIASAREQQMQFYQEVVRLATNDCLRLVEPTEMPSPQGDVLPVQTPLDASRLRRRALAAAEEAGMATERAEDFALAVGEAVSNVLKHATGGVAHVWSTENAVYVFVADTGHGITMDMLPKALSPGWSSMPSLGMGFTLMMEMADALWLSTGQNGTIVCIEQSIRPPEDPLLHTLLLDDAPALG